MTEVPDADTFDAYLADLLDDALDDIDPAKLEEILQQRAQEMHELKDWQEETAGEEYR